METNNDVLKIDVPARRDLAINSLNILLVTGIVLAISYLWGMHHTSNVFPLILGLIYGYFLSKCILNKESGKKLITVDERWLIVEYRMGSKLEHRVFKRDFMENVSIVPGYKETIWLKIKAFWLRDSVGPIQFKYENKPYRLGYGLEPEAVNSLIAFLKNR